MRLIERSVNGENPVLFIDPFFEYDQALGDPITHLLGATPDLMRMLTRTLPHYQSIDAASDLLAKMFKTAPQAAAFVSEEHAIGAYTESMGGKFTLRHQRGKSFEKHKRDSNRHLDSVILPTEFNEGIDCYRLVAAVHTHPVRRDGSNQAPSGGDCAYVTANRRSFSSDIMMSSFYPHLFAVVNVLEVDLIRGRKQLGTYEASELYNLELAPNTKAIPRAFNVLWMQDAMVMTSPNEVVDPQVVGGIIESELDSNGLYFRGVQPYQSTMQMLGILNGSGIAASLRGYEIVNGKHVDEISRVDGNIDFFFPPALLVNRIDE